MVLLLCRTKQAQARLRGLANQVLRSYYQIHQASSVIRESRVGVVNGGPSLGFYRTGSEVGNFVRFFAAPFQAKPKYEEKDDKGRPKMNEEISAQSVRLVTDEGHAVVSRHEALERARKLKVDLVEVQPDGKPPVCKLMDYNKEMYARQVKEKEATKSKSKLVLRKGGLKEVRITVKIDKHDMQTKADTVKRMAERGHRVKVMALAIAGVKLEEQNLGELLSRLYALIEDFSLVESGPIVEAKQAYAVVRHVKFGPLKKGPVKKISFGKSTKDATTDSSDNLEQNETNEHTISDEPIESDSPDDFDFIKDNTHDDMMKFTPEASNADRTGLENRYASATGSENRYATKRWGQSQNPGNNQQFDLNRRVQGEPPPSYGMFGGRPKPNSDPQRESGPVEGNRYKKGPGSQQPHSDYRGPRGDFSRENTEGNRHKKGGLRR